MTYVKKKIVRDPKHLDKYQLNVLAKLVDNGMTRITIQQMADATGRTKDSVRKTITNLVAVGAVRTEITYTLTELGYSSFQMGKLLPLDDDE